MSTIIQRSGAFQAKLRLAGCNQDLHCPELSS